jgi:hypothetical protein
MGIRKIMERYSHISQIAGTLNASRRLSRHLNCREQEANENSHDADHNQQFDNGKSAFTVLHRKVRPEAVSLVADNLSTLGKLNEVKSMMW